MKRKEPNSILINDDDDNQPARKKKKVIDLDQEDEKSKTKGYEKFYFFCIVFSSTKFFLISFDFTYF